MARAVYSMYALDPDSVRGVFEVVERGRAEGQRRLAQRLHDQGHLRANVVVFIDGQRSRDRVHLADPLLPQSRVHVLQALSGG